MMRDGLTPFLVSSAIWNKGMAIFFEEWKALSGHTGHVSSLKFSPDGKCVAASCTCLRIILQHFLVSLISVIFLYCHLNSSTQYTCLVHLSGLAADGRILIWDCTR